VLEVKTAAGQIILDDERRWVVVIRGHDVSEWIGDLMQCHDSFRRC
jgi:hypothetical protein